MELKTERQKVKMMMDDLVKTGNEYLEILAHMKEKFDLLLKEKRKAVTQARSRLAKKELAYTAAQALAEDREFVQRLKQKVPADELPEQEQVEGAKSLVAQPAGKRRRVVVESDDDDDDDDEEEEEEDEEDGEEEEGGKEGFEDDEAEEGEEEEEEGEEEEGEKEDE